MVAYLEGLSREVAREGVRGVVFLDNAPFHRSRAFREAAGRWRERGLEVAYLPRYSPHLNPVEGVAAGEGVFDAPEALRERGGAEGAVAEALERLRERMGQGVLQGLCSGHQLASPVPQDIPRPLAKHLLPGATFAVLSIEGVSESLFWKRWNRYSG